MDHQTKQLLRYLILPLVILTAVVWIGSRQARPDFLLHVHFYDVGQGDGIMIQTHLGNQVIIDGGPSDQIVSRLGQDLPFWDREIEMIILTHGDADHVSGLIDIIKKYKVKKILMTKKAAKTAVYSEFLRLAEEKGIEKIYAQTGQRVWLDSATVFDIYYPPAGIEETNLETNDTSIMGKLTFGKTALFFTGDATSSIERQLLPMFDLDADVLKVGHHGSKTSTASEFVAEISPQYAVIQVGAENNYGHPTPEVLGVLGGAGVQVLRTDVEKDIEFVSDGFNLVRK